MNAIDLDPYGSVLHLQNRLQNGVWNVLWDHGTDYGIKNRIIELQDR